MPGYHRAPVSAEVTVEPAREGERPPREPHETMRRVAGESGLARDSGPGSLMLAGDAGPVLAALAEVLGAALEAGAERVQVRLEATREAPRFAGEPADGAADGP